jgi:simple sugar transport system ATP-binding protein
VRAGEAVLSLRDLTVQGRRGETAAKDVSLDVHGGEIVGIAGVDGSGQTELIEAILGLREIAGGEILLGGENVNGLPVAARRARGIAYVPEDRHHRALVLPFSVEENAVLGRQREPAFAAGPGRVWLRREALRQFLRERADAFDVRGATPGTRARALSGGNQQKLVLARELSRQPRLARGRAADARAGLRGKRLCP